MRAQLATEAKLAGTERVRAGDVGVVQVEGDAIHWRRNPCRPRRDDQTRSSKQQREVVLRRVDIETVVNRAKRQTLDAGSSSDHSGVLDTARSLNQRDDWNITTTPLT